MSPQQKKEEFSVLFDKYYKRLFNYAFKMLKEEDVSDEMVQETFIKLWENFESINNSTHSIEPFLIVILKNKIIDNYRKSQTRNKHINLYSLNSTIQNEIDNEWEISQQIEEIYNFLHPKTVEIFKLSRDKGLSYKEIAIQKSISIKTVELHISKALVAFRKGLKEYL